MQKKKKKEIRKMDWVKTTVSMPLFLSIIMITIMVTPCIEDIKTKSSPKK